MIPYPSWLNSGDNTWQLVAATLVGLMSIPGIAILYGGLVQRKWIVNTMLMAFTAFSVVLVAWVLYEFQMSFGTPMHLGPGILHSAVGRPGTILGAKSETGQANIPLVSGQGLMPAFRFPQSSLAYFQFAFAAITPLLFLGSVIGRMNFRAWLLFVLLWSGIVYSVNAFLLWGGGWWAQMGALDYSGGYVIHLAAGTSGFVAAAVIGPRLARDRAKAVPNNLPMVACGAGFLWLGWNGFNGGDEYFGGQNASAAVLNTNLTTAVALLTWVLLDMFLSKQRKPTFLGAVNGMIVGLVAITPAAGFVTGTGAILIGVIASAVVWCSWNYFAKVSFMRKVDDALGVFHTHGVAGLLGGLLVGLFADPAMAVYYNKDGSAVSVAGLFHGHPKQLALQAGAAATIIVWDGLMTFLILKFLGLFMKLRLPDDVLELGDVEIHDEEAYPSEDGLVAVGAAPSAPSSSTASSSSASSTASSSPASSSATEPDRAAEPAAEP
ncbi:ammonium transporter [Streptacidiphilus albus]|uniref:ammonium transporter n=1 Tax=Streptacidiphilus albus TaxID=105425 RepID=UPI00054B3048|nr:ammonium transporter [Streptacidiphilus albus]